jgi:phytoene dehydrogenase-like protein
LESSSDRVMADVAIVGAGLAGICCALRLREIGLSFNIFEASDAVGGRVRTDELDGFRLDRGFQVLLTAYPEVQRMLDFGPLDLKPFYHGALIRRAGRFQRVADPRRHPWAGIKSFAGPIGSLADRFRLLSLLSKTKSGTLANQMARPEGLTLDLLRWHGFSDAMIGGFFRPFFGSVFLERDLVTSSRLFRLVFRMLAEGDAAVPNRGMGAIPEQLASRLPADSMRFHAPVERIEPGRVVLRGGESITANAVVVATEALAAARLLGQRIKAPSSRGVACMYFAADQSPVREAILVLNADEPGPINHLAVMSDVAPGYAPAGAALIGVTVLGIPALDDPALESAVRGQLTGWYGNVVGGWRHLRTLRIPDALPDQTAPALDPPERPVDLGDGLFVCGDHRDTATMNGAMASGWRAAQAVAESLAR